MEAFQTEKFWITFYHHFLAGNGKFIFRFHFDQVMVWFNTYFQELKFHIKVISRKKIYETALLNVEINKTMQRHFHSLCSYVHESQWQMTKGKKLVFTVRAPL